MEIVDTQWSLLYYQSANWRKDRKTTEIKGALPALCGRSERSQGVDPGRGPGLRFHEYCCFRVRQSPGAREIHCQCSLRKRFDAKAVRDASTYPMVKSINNWGLPCSLCWNTISQSSTEIPPWRTEGRECAHLFILTLKRDLELTWLQLICSDGKY